LPEIVGGGGGTGFELTGSVLAGEADWRTTGLGTIGAATRGRGTRGEGGEGTEGAGTEDAEVKWASVWTAVEVKA
jgi:hypothetical protein